MDIENVKLLISGAQVTGGGVTRGVLTLFTGVLVDYATSALFVFFGVRKLLKDIGNLN